MPTTTTAEVPDTVDKDVRKLKKVLISLMRQPEFALFSGTMMCGSLGISDEFPTAATDGFNVVFGRKFLRQLDEKMVGFVLMHETLHKSFRHLSIYRKLFEEDAQLCNQAADYVINLLLVELDPTGKFITFPVVDGQRVGLLDQKYAGMNTKQVFDMLKQNPPPPPPSGGGQGQPGEGGKPGNNQAAGGFDEHLWEEAQEVSPEKQAEQAKELDRALRQGQALAAKQHGKGGGNMHRELGELLDPQLDWKELLREFVQASCSNKDVSSWRRVNRRFIAQDIYMPSLVGETVREIVVGVDTSGSIGGPDLRNFLSEVAAVTGLVAPEKLHLLYWDGAVAGVETYDRNNMGDLATSTKPKGGGGTDPQCVSVYLEKHKIKPECILMLTDGYVPNWGTGWTAPMLWVVAGNPKATSTVGKTLHINS